MTGAIVREAHSRFLPQAIAGSAATFAGVGISRFAYVPLFPMLVSAGWVTGPEGGLLGALNLTGYLGGVFCGRPLAGRIGVSRALDAGMALAALALLACAWNGGFAWLGFWRLMSGVAGGGLMALAGPAVQGAVPPARRGTAGGIVLGGVGAGVVGAALLVPLISALGIPAIWGALALLVALLWAGVRPYWPDTPLVLATPAAVPAKAGILYAFYAISAAGLVPHMVYFADLVVRGRGFDARSGILVWVLFGAGGLAGTLLAGRASDRWGARIALQLWLAAQAVALATALASHAALLAVSATLGGFTALGMAAAALARAREIAGPAAGTVWVRATAAFAIAQAVTGFALAALFRHTGSHDALFGAGLALSVVAFAVAILGSRWRVGAA